MDDHIEKLLSEISRIYSCSVSDYESFEIFKNSGCPVTSIEQLLAISCHCLNIDETVETFTSKYPIREDLSDQFKESIRRILSFALGPTSSERNDFLSKCAELHNIYYINIYDGKYEYPELPKCSQQNTAFVDLASGPDFTNFLPFIEPRVNYFAVDNSYFVTEVIRRKCDDYNIRNVCCLNNNVADLTLENFNRLQIEIIRAKNIFTYVNDYFNVFQKHLSWICTGGKFIFSEQAQQREANTTFAHELVFRNFIYLAENGFDFDWLWGDTDNPLDLNSVILTKTIQANTVETKLKIREFYSQLENRYNITMNHGFNL